MTQAQRLPSVLCVSAVHSCPLVVLFQLDSETHNDDTHPESYAHSHSCHLTLANVLTEGV